MKKLLVLALLCAATSFSVQAQKAETDDQKAVMKEFLAKYDTNKDGKLDKDEKSKFTDEDKAKWKKAFPKKAKKAAADSTASTGATGDSKPAAPATGATTGN